MTPNAGGPQELESLVARVMLDPMPFLQGAGVVTQAMDALVAKFTQAQQALGQLRLPSTNLAANQLGLLTKEVDDLFKKLNWAARARQTNALATFDNNLKGLAGTLSSVTANTANITALQTGLEGFVQSLATMNNTLTNVGVKFAKSLSGIGSFLANVNTLDLNKLKALPQALAGFMGQFNKLAAQSMGTQNLAQTLSQLGSAVRGLTSAASGMKGGGGSGGGPGGGGSGLLGWLGGVPPAARRAGESLRTVGYDMMRLEGSAANAGASLMTLRFGLLGIGLLGAYQFANLDDALTRASAHARDFAKSNQGELSRGIFNISGQSITSATQLAKALDELQVAGLSATGAVKGLGIAENFAAAAGMDAGEAAKRLTGLLHAMGQTGDTADEFRQNMVGLSDLLVGVSRRSGSTEQELMQAFTSRFLTAAHVAKLTMEESVQILALFSRAGEGFRGTKGGNIASRAIEMLAVDSVGSRSQWQAMLGQSAFDAEGKLRPFMDLLVDLKSKMADVGTERFIAELDRLGMGGRENLNAIEPLLRVIGGVKDLREDMAELAGITAKTAETIRSSFMGQMMNLWINVSNTAAVIGERLAPALYLVTKPLSDALYLFTKLNPAMQDLIVVTGALVLAFNPLVRSFLLWTAMTAVSPFVHFANGLWAAGAAVVSLTYNIGVGLYNAVVQTFGFAISSVVNLLVGFYKVGDFVVKNLTALGSVSGKLFGMMMDSVASFIQMTTVAIGKVLLGLLTSVLTIITSIATALFVLPTLIATVAAPLVTLGVAVGGLVTLVGSGLVQAWRAVRDNSQAVLEWTGNKIIEITSNVSAMWSSLMRGSGAFFRSFASNIGTAAGLLWNFKHNFNALISFVEEHGFAPFGEILEAIMMSVEDAVGNVGKFLMAVGYSIKAVFDGVYYTITEVFSKSFKWLQSQWGNIAHDIGMVFGALMDNMLTNWAAMTRAMNRIAAASRHEFLMSSPFTGRVPEATAKWAAEERAAAFKELREGMSFELNIDTSKFKTELTTGMGKAIFGEILPAELKGVWLDAGADMAKAFAAAFKEMNPIFQAFELLQYSPLLNELAGRLLLDPPTLKEAGDSLRKAMGFIDQEGKTSPSIENLSNAFKMTQGSSARFIYNSEFNQRVEHEMLVELKKVNKNLEMGMAQRGIPVSGFGATIVKPGENQVTLSD